MTASYVLVTAMAVLLVEGIAIGVVIPGLLAQADLSSRVRTTVVELAASVGLNMTGRAPGKLAIPSLKPVGGPASTVKPGVVTASGNGIAIPQVSGDVPHWQLVPASVVISPQGQIPATSFPFRYPVGAGVDQLLPKTWRDMKGGGLMTQAGATIVWATAPIFPDVMKNGYAGKGDLLGTVYVQRSTAPAMPPVSALASGSVPSGPYCGGTSPVGGGCHPSGRGGGGGSAGASRSPVACCHISCWSSRVTSLIALAVSSCASASRPAANCLARSLSRVSRLSRRALRPTMPAPPVVHDAQNPMRSKLPRRPMHQLGPQCRPGGLHGW